MNALIQYNSTVKEISSNIRFNFIYKPLSDIFLVYNERRSSTGEVLERTLVAKFTYLFDFDFQRPSPPRHQEENSPQRHKDTKKTNSLRSFGARPGR